MKKKLLFVTSFVLAVFVSFSSYSQVSSYGFTQTTGSYGAANSGSMVGIILQDDDVTNVSLPFNFTFDGNSYSNINVCTNGYLSFNSLTGSEYLAISDLGTQNVIAPFSQDMLMATIVTGDFTSGSNIITNVSSTNGISVGDSLLDLFFDFGGISPTVTAIAGSNITVNVNALNSSQANPLIFMNGYVRQSVSGVAPNRICEFEYRNMTRFGVFDEVINFKVKLYETSNKIEFVYGPIFPNIDNVNSEVGLKGSAPNDFNSRFVPSGVSWGSSAAAGNITDDCDFSSLNFPANGLIYAWAPQPCIAPVLIATPTNSSICAGQSATITTSGATTYSWDAGGNNPPVVISPTQAVISPTSTTTYTLTGYNGACSSSVQLTQTVVPLPTLTFTQSSPVICAGNTAIITASGAVSYTWSNGVIGSQIAVSPSTNTTYVVTGTDLGCVSQPVSISQSVSICTDIKSHPSEAKLLVIYPNPNSGSFVIKTNGREIDSHISIYNVLGAKVHTQVSDGGNDEIQVNVSLPGGIYYVELKNLTGKQVKQMVITK